MRSQLVSALSLSRHLLLNRNKKNKTKFATYKLSPKSSSYTHRDGECQCRLDIYHIKSRLDAGICHTNAYHQPVEFAQQIDFGLWLECDSSVHHSQSVNGMK